MDANSCSRVPVRRKDRQREHRIRHCITLSNLRLRLYRYAGSTYSGGVRDSGILAVPPLGLRRAKASLPMPVRFRCVNQPCRPSSSAGRHRIEDFEPTRGKCSLLGAVGSDWRSRRGRVRELAA
jgi:hypothetical protein